MQIFKRKIISPEKKMTIGEIAKDEGFKISYSKLKKAYNTCELSGKESDECRKILKELKIDIIE